MRSFAIFKPVFPVIFLSICLFSKIFAQHSEPGQPTFNIRSWQVEAGIPPIIQTLAQGPDGYLWIGCDAGVIRFDGFSSRIFDRHSSSALTEDDCLALCFLPDSTLFCGMYNGLLAGYRTDSFFTVEPAGPFNGKSITWMCSGTGGELWIATEGAGIIRYAGHTFTSYTTREGLPSNGISSLCCLSDGSVWGGTESGLVSIRDEEVTVFNRQNGLLFDDISILHADTGSGLWIGGYEGGLMHYNGSSFREIRQAPFPLSIAIRALYLSPDGALWVGTSGQGLIRYIPATGEWLGLTTADGLSTDLITTIIPDMEGNLLVGTEGGGLNRVRANLLITLTRRQGLPDNHVMTLFTDHSGSVWVGCVDGSVSAFSNGRFRDHSPAFRIDGLPVFSIGGTPEGTILAATMGELVSVKANHREVFGARQGLNNTLFHAVYVDRSGTVWAGTDAGIYLLGQEEVTFLNIEAGLTDEKIFCFLEDRDGRMWIGTQEGGINIWDQGTIRSITRKDGLSDNLILCLYQDAGGSVWVGTGHDGLNRIDGSSGEISQANAFLDYPRFITFIREDRYGRLWMGSSDGLIAVDRRLLEQAMQQGGPLTEVYRFRQAEGMPDQSCTAGTFPTGCIAPDSTIWFATAGGIAVVDPATVIMPSLFPPLFTEEILVNGKPVPRQASYILPPGIIQLEIRFTAPGFLAPEELRFRYRLEGYDNDWMDAGSRRSAFYTRIPPGAYRFRVQVCNHNGQWDERESSVPIRISAFFYQTVWFILLCILGGALILYAAITYRLRQIREKELEALVQERTGELLDLNRELDQRVLDRTAELAAANKELEAFSYSVSHDLRAPVRRIEGLVEALTEDYHDTLDQPGKDFLEKISASTREMGTLIEEFLKLARIARQEIDKTSVDLTALVGEILQDLALRDPGRPTDILIQPGLQANADLRLIRIALQNLLENAWKYTGKEAQPRIEFGMQRDSGIPVYFIRDNGVGFDMHHYEKLFTPFLRLHSDDQFTGTGIGLATVKRIIVKHGGKIWATSEPGQGSAFFFTL